MKRKSIWRAMSLVWPVDNLHTNIMWGHFGGDETKAPTRPKPDIHVAQYTYPIPQSRSCMSMTISSSSIHDNTSFALQYNCSDDKQSGRAVRARIPDKRPRSSRVSRNNNGLRLPEIPAVSIRTLDLITLRVTSEETEKRAKEKRD